MNYKDLMDSLFFNTDIVMTDMKKGLTNHNFLLEMDGRKFVTRIPRADADNIVNRHHETLALAAIADADIDVETIYFDEVSGYKVTAYLEDAKTYQECEDNDKIEQVAVLMKHFHRLGKTIGEDFDPIKRLHNYQRLVKHPFLDLSAYAWIENSISHLNNPKVLCHNDWVDGNILFSAHRAYLIDYEYAADNDPLFDVMSFLSENEITEPELRERFYRVYFDEMTTKIREELDLWENFHNYLWCYWAMMMYESRHEDIYQEIAKSKYQALQQKNA